MQRRSFLGVVLLGMVLQPACTGSELKEVVDVSNAMRRIHGVMVAHYTDEGVWMTSVAELVKAYPEELQGIDLAALQGSYQLTLIKATQQPQVTEVVMRAHVKGVIVELFGDGHVERRKP